MNERFVANNSQRGYAQSSRETIMSGVDSRPEAQMPKRGSRKAVEPQKVGKPESKSPKAKTFIERMQARFGPRTPQENPLIHPTVPWEVGRRAAEARQQPQITFNVALEQAKVINALRDERDVTISSLEMDRFKEMLLRSGKFSAGEIEKMSPAEVIGASQFALRGFEMMEPEDSDFKYTKDSKQRRAEEPVARQEITKAQSGDEEILTPEKIGKLITVQEYAGAGRGAGAGAMEAGGGGNIFDRIRNRFRRRPSREEERARETHEAVGRPDIREVIGEMTRLVREGRNVAGNADWQNLSRHLRERIQEFNQAAANRKFKVTYEFVQAVDDAVYLAENYKGTPQERQVEVAALNTVLPVAERQGFEEKMTELDVSFQAQYDRMDDRTRKMVFQDLELEMGTELQAILSGWHSVEEASFTIFGGLHPRLGQVDGVVQKGIAREKSLGLDGIREWRATKELYGAQERVSIELLTRPPARWQEVPQYLSTVYRLIESTEFTVDELQIYINKAINLLESIPTTDKRGRDLRTELIRELDAFRAFHSFRISMEREDMNPKNMAGVFQTYFDDETWANFVARFNKDERHREFVDDKGGSVNLFDTSFRLYSERLRLDRIRMNIVESLTRHEIGAQNPAALKDIQEWAGLRDENGQINKFFPMSEADFNSEVENLGLQIKQKIGKRITKDPNVAKMLKSLEVAGTNIVNDLRREYDALPEAQRAKLEFSRYFEENSRGKINDQMLANAVDEASRDIWGRKGSKKVDGVEVDFLDVTKDVIQDWYTQETLQGAHGYDNGRSCLAIRREELLQGLKSELGNLISQGKLKIKMGERTSEVNLEALEASGLLESIDYNAYYLAWMMEWSSYDSLRIYSRDTNTNLDDIYERIVINQSTNLFWGRHIDHIWEFYHDDNEKRGRPKQNDVNEIWKQHLPGKHHYLFPQNNIMVRWAANFMTQEQKDEVERRTVKLMAEHDFDNEKYHKDFVEWIRSAAVIDMVENGELSFGQKNFSKIAREEKIRKFEMIDIFIDRNKHLEYVGPNAFQAYLANPTSTKFVEINDKEKVFYSTRAARQFPWMTLAFRAHWELQSKHMQRLFNKLNMSAASAEELTDGLIADGQMERKQGEQLKGDLFGLKEIDLGGSWGIPKMGTIAAGDFFGTTPFRRVRQMFEGTRRLTWNGKWLPLSASLAGVWEAIVAFFKQLPKELSR